MFFSRIQIAQSVYDNYKKYDGFVVIHGTDTLTYTSSALSFLLENLHKPVIVTGSQIPMKESYSDAVNNLLGSMVAAASPYVNEVACYFKDYLMRGNRAVKYSSVLWNGFNVGDGHHLGRWERGLTLYGPDLLPSARKRYQREVLLNGTSRMLISSFLFIKQLYSISILICFLFLYSESFSSWRALLYR